MRAAPHAQLNWKEILRKTDQKVKTVRPPIPPLHEAAKGSRDADF